MRRLPPLNLAVHNRDVAGLNILAVLEFHCAACSVNTSILLQVKQSGRYSSEFGIRGEGVPVDCKSVLVHRFACKRSLDAVFLQSILELCMSSLAYVWSLEVCMRSEQRNTVN